MDQGSILTPVARPDPHHANMILIIDNYDSFVHNLARYIRRSVDTPVQIVRNDAVRLADVDSLKPSAIILSPGPCGPEQAGISLDLVRRFGNQIPILGVCLGHQTIVQAAGGTIGLAPEPFHGRSSPIFHSNHPLFDHIPSPFTAGRYHSLIAEPDSLPPTLIPIAHLEDGTLMAVADRRVPVVGVQFHPESILTEYGDQLIHNFLRWARIDARKGPPRTPSHLEEVAR